jgi:hypothetical protein
MGTENELNTDLINIMTDFNKIKEVDNISDHVFYFYHAIVNVMTNISIFSVLYEGAYASTEV